MNYKLTVWGYLEEDGTEVLDFKSHPTDKNRGINLMIKNSGYYLSRIVPYILKNKNKKFRLDNISTQEEAILYYLGLDKVCNTVDFDIISNKRIWIENIISSTPELVNTLWMFDYKGMSPKVESDYIPLSQNISYSRPEILEFDKKIYKEFKPTNSKLALIPCTQGKPYHKRKYKVDSEFTKISGKGKDELQRYINDESYDKIVLTSLGLIPRDNWEDPIVLAYNTGTRDLWKLLCLCKKFFLKNKYEEYLVFVKFKPYRDIIRLLMDMGVIEREKVKFIGDDEKSNGLRIMFYPNDYKLYE